MKRLSATLIGFAWRGENGIAVRSPFIGKDGLGRNKTSGMKLVCPVQRRRAGGQCYLKIGQ